ncbi:MAG: BamA/TamA family outer membrane protein [Ideonella sp.]|nr:BamA/TamA family outer membrane protein [Ideonella sp.]
MRAARRLAARLALAAAAACLGGCASLEPLLADLSGRPPAALPGEGQPAPQGASEPALPDAYTLEVRAPAPLRGLLVKHLDLARFRDARAAGDMTRLELDRLISAAPAQVRAIAETEGYFEAEVSVTRDRAEPPRVLVVVVPGPRAHVEEVGLGLAGTLLDAVQAGDEAAVDLAAELLEQWPLAQGDAFTQEAWSSAKLSTLARLQARGYPAARLADSSAQIDAHARAVRLQLTLDSGPQFRLGQLRITGLAHYAEDTVRNLLDFQPGQAYSEALLADWQRHLQRSELFEAALVELIVDPEQAAAATVVVTLREMPRQQTTVGLGYSTDTGARATLDYIHRKPFGWRVVSTSKLEIGKEKNALSTQLITHPMPDHYRDLAGIDLERLDQDGELRTSAALRLGRNQDRNVFARQYFIAVQSATVESAAPKTSAQAVTLNYHWVTRDIDSIALPTRGTVFAFETAAGYTYKTLAETGALARLQATLTGYRPLPGDWNLQWRLQGGEVFARSATGVPDTLLFRAGGQDSVRGYSFRSLGPVVNGAVTSGRMLLTGSVEMARPIVERLPSLWGALFVDAGNASDSWREMRPVYSVGPGIRWRSPVGALRVDFPYAVDDRRWRVEISLGIAP